MKNRDICPPTASIQNAIKQLIQSGHQNPSSNRVDFKDACEELLSFSFSTEEGYLHIISTLTELNGNFVAKIIHKGLASVRQVYTESKIFEDEARKLVDLCFSLYQRHGEASTDIVSCPALVVDLVEKLSNAIKNPESLEAPTSSIKLSKCLEKLLLIHKIIVYNKAVVSFDYLGVLLSPDPQNMFQETFDSLKARVNDDHFLELLDETILVVQHNEKNYQQHQTSLFNIQPFEILKNWNCLLEKPFISNWFAIQVAKCDTGQSVGDQLNLKDLLLYQLNRSFERGLFAQGFSCSGHEDKLEVLFQRHDVFRCFTDLCLKLSQIDVPATCLKTLLNIASNIPNEDPSSSKTENYTSSSSPLNRLIHNIAWSCKISFFNYGGGSATLLRPFQLQTFTIAAEAIFMHKGGYSGMEKFLKFCQESFKEYQETSYMVLLIILAATVIEPQRRREQPVYNQEFPKESPLYYDAFLYNLTSFMSQLSKETLSSHTGWIWLVLATVRAFPETWYCQESLRFIEFFSNEVPPESRDEARQTVLTYLTLMGPVYMKTILIYMVELFQELKYDLEEYKLHLCVLMAIVPFMEEASTMTYKADFLRAVRSYGDISSVQRLLFLVKNDQLCFNEVKLGSVLMMIAKSRSIENEEKEEIFNMLLQTIQNCKDKCSLVNTLKLCMQFVLSPVNAIEVKQFLIRVANSNNLQSCELVVDCQIIQTRHGKRNSGLQKALFSATDSCLRSEQQICTFSKVISKYLPTIVQISNAETQCILATAIAGAISVNTFDEIVFDFAVPYVCYFVMKNSNCCLITGSNALVLLIEVSKSFRLFYAQTNNTVNKTISMDNYDHMLLKLQDLSLSFSGTILLINSVRKMLKRGNITTADEMMSITSHLFEMPRTKLSKTLQQNLLNRHIANPSITAGELLIHYVEALNMSAVQIQKLVRLSHTNFSSCQPTLMRLLVKKCPISFSQRKSNKLLMLIINQTEANREYIELFLQLIDIVVKDNVSVEEFQKGIDRAQALFNMTDSHLIPLAVSLIKACYNIGFEDERHVRSLILIMNEIRQSGKDLEQMTKSQFFHRQLALACKTAPSFQEMSRRIERLINMVNTLDNKAIIFQYIHVPVFNTIVIIEHDFQMLLANPCLTTADVCTALLVTATQSILFSNMSSVVTPGELALWVLHELKRLDVNEEELKYLTLEICANLVEALKDGRCANRCTKCYEIPEDQNTYIDFFIDILKASGSLDAVQHWLNWLTVHVGKHALLCKKLVLESCKWRKDNSKECLEISQQVVDVLSKICENKCLNHAKREISVMCNIIQVTEDKGHIYELFQTLQDGVSEITLYCIEAAVSGWSNLLERLNALNQIRNYIEIQTLTSCKPAIKMLPYLAKACQSSSGKLLSNFKTLIDKAEIYSLTDSLKRISAWSEQMENVNISRQIIDSWCTSLLLYETLTSRDIDAIANLTPKAIHLLTNDSGKIEECLFKDNAPKTWQEGNSDPAVWKQSVAHFKRCLQYAKILGEFTSVAQSFKDQEFVLATIRSGAHDLCKSFKHQSSPGAMFKVRFKTMKDLFCLLFSGNAVTVTRETLPSHNKLVRSLVNVFRRLARSFKFRPVVIGHVKSVIHHTLQEDGHFKEPNQLENAIHNHVIELEPNQDAIHSLQASGYNQGDVNEDLWYSTSTHFSSYVYGDGLAQRSRVLRLLKQILREWQDVLEALKITEVNVNGQSMKTPDLTSYTDSLETIKSRLEAVKHTTMDSIEGWGAERRRQLIRKEEYFLTRIKEEEEANQEQRVSQLVKLVIVWNNQLLDCVNTCTENIPGCYAPNGFHSEKPVICGLAVDNRILTLYKQEKTNTRTELEDVEVKLYPVGMLVYDLHSKAHCHDTDQLWAAFFKMLLLKRLVPRIFLTSNSPGFEWIKEFVIPEASKPDRILFISCNTLIPPREDSFDYNPNSQMTGELIVLTRENVEPVKFTKLKSPKRDQLIQQVMKRIPQLVKDDRRFSENHPKPEVREQLLKRLHFAIRKATEDAVDGAIPENENVSGHINREKLSLKCEDKAIVLENGAGFYSDIIVDVLQAFMDDNMEFCRSYDCCESVDFFPSTCEAIHRLQESNEDC